MADQLGRSVGDMYEGAFVPGLVLSALYAGYVLLTTTIFPNAGPGLPQDAIGFREPSGARASGSSAFWCSSPPSSPITSWARPPSGPARTSLS
jgi:TRAP-type mannitol/chloroaromatic compound transport system permease large subunit